MTMNTRQVQEHLRHIGWPIAVDGSFGPSTRSAVKAFQQGYGFEQLLVDGYAGTVTQHAIVKCAQNDGKCASFFTFKEFKSKGDGWIKVERTLVRSLDTARRNHGPIEVISGYRDPLHNRKVGGTPNSQHLYGNAADISFIDGDVHWTDLADEFLFSGIGYKGSTGRVMHVDVRHVGPNTTNGSVAKPSLWKYA